MSRSTLVLPLAVAACFAETWADGSARFPAETDTDAGTSAATSSGASEAPGDSFQTVTSDTPTGSSGPSETATTFEGPANEPPEIVSFTVEPDTLHEAGTAEAHAVVSADVVSLELHVDGQPVWSGPPAEFAWSFAATSKAASEGTYTLELVVRDREGLTASATAMLWVTLPETGAEKCVFTEDVLASRLTATVYADDALIVVGSLSNPSREATVWRLDPDSCQPQAGYPWKLSQWSALKVQGTSEAVGLAIDGEGRMAIAANIGEGLVRQPYLAVLSPEGALEWEHLGPMGQTYSGITAAPDRFFVVGEQLQIVDGKAPRDGLVESFDAEGKKVWWDILAAPLPGDNFPGDPKTLDEHPRAVTWQEESQTLLLVGERLVSEDIVFNWTRAFSARYTGNGALVGAWTSSGLDGDEDGLLAIADCGGFPLAAGWVGSGPNSRSPATRWLDPLGNGDKRRLDNLLHASMQAVACDREQKVAGVATTIDSTYVVGFKGSDDPFLFKHLFPQATLTAVDCDSRGFCATAGLLGNHAWVRVHHP
ncbi:hypothetical protein SAMN02745121_01567 [Nannocystis exedens]|uniref:Uncharacterized protein n=1 Tax=Nannocystis exedens TaxID=54 RepID=A0A1I1V8H8_9BACT|nr:hypothetical protein [Nannocystis exedens]PCC72364.1 hypothetical protein NAEX_05444 [Nannocystis exedens]SFD78288.1 hypothetical protein SAMN02745121_01567 [Nannocystis exedens]